MQYFIGVKLVEAELKSKLIDGVSVPGYKVVYPDGYESWSPKDVFEKAYLELAGNGNTISQEMVQEFVANTQVRTFGNKTTCVQVILKNGFVITESSSCVDPANYSEAMGSKICIAKINEKIWELLGFLLQTAIGGVK